MKEETWRVPLVAQIAVGVCLGNLAAAFVIWRVSIWQTERAVQQARATLEHAAAAGAKRAREVAESAKLVDIERRARAADAQAASDKAKRDADIEAARREAAWRAFYKSPPGCDASKAGEWTVDCANDFMRAKKRFDGLYDAGNL